ncbi:uncharacterized protein MONOS_8684 [Monocercomonoides exilis]|uniref:uncharacterized protein n=1 Tax=Monocercomonoides exilis TaxID=2049356 RepID=UPI00355A1B63|nr:hypothetical protein MONOS_8684 [Monocercomonoides exilis]|eukprot:MONOS_8684.1-p1 / transcript=MONOS_8684.1 / gene=MONOS_8684 / organism=Monocercomonoides_exilis_PA203 / gene_product=unspecified product / transcript_product=unspecified product / location=Mono_scaffold00334:22349-23209(+) / protein_length=287 / sequence_SO=supercontig / SO=protein_coding / is_pseudo=false
MITHQQREMSAETNTEVFVLGVPLKHRRINSSIERGKAFFISRAAETLGEVMYKSQTDSCERLGVSYWEAKHNSFCHSRRIPPSRSYASLAPKECQNSRMERDDEDECISPQGDQRMEEDIEADQESGISFGFHSSSCSDYRCSGTSMGCDIQNQQQFFGLACQFSLICPQPVVQLQRTTSCFASSAPFCLDYPEQQKNSSIASVGQQLSSLQRESLECGEESSASATQDMEMDGGKESDNKSTTSPRHKERQSRCTVPPGKSRGQRDQKRHIQRDTCSVESETDS